MMNVCALLSMLFAACMDVGVTAGGLDAIAEHFFPESLREWSRTHPGAADARQWTAVEADLDATGAKNYVVVAYSDGSSGRVRVIKRTPDGPQLVAEPNVAFEDRSPEIVLRDLDADGRAEVVVTYLSGNDAVRHSWILRWRNSSLTCMAAAQAECPDFIDPVFVDVNGDRRLEIIEPADGYGSGVEFESPEQAAEHGPVVPDRRSHVYVLTDDMYEESGATLEYFNVFKRSRGAPARYEDRFRSTPGDFVLRVVHGDPDSGKLIDSGQIVINGDLVVGPSSFTQKRRVLEIPVRLKTKNTIEVELVSAPGASLRVLILPK